RWSIFREQRGSIYSMALSPDGKQIAIGGLGLRDGSAAVLDRMTHMIAHGVTRKMTLGRQQSTIWAITFSARGDRIAYGTDDGNVGLWQPGLDDPRKAFRRLGNHAPVSGSTNRVRCIELRDDAHVITAREYRTGDEWDA